MCLNAQEYMLPCLSKKWLGIECPGCGMQRALYLLYKGDFVASFQMYPALYPAMVLLLFLGLSFFVKLKHAHTVKWGLFSITMGTLIVSYMLKMLPLLLRL